MAWACTSTGEAGQVVEGIAQEEGGKPHGMGNWTSARKLEAAGDEQPESESAQESQGLGVLKFFRRGQWAPREVSDIPSERFYQELDPIPKTMLSSWGRRGARLRRAARRSCPPLYSLTMWVAGDGGEREENYRYHRLMGNLVSSTVLEDDLPPPTWYEVPRDQVVGPPPAPPLRYLADGMIMAEGHSMPNLTLAHGLQRAE